MTLELSVIVFDTFWIFGTARSNTKNKRHKQSTTIFLGGNKDNINMRPACVSASICFPCCARLCLSCKCHPFANGSRQRTLTISRQRTIARGTTTLHLRILHLWMSSLNWLSRQRSSSCNSFVATLVKRRSLRCSGNHLPRSEQPCAVLRATWKRMECVYPCSAVRLVSSACEPLSCAHADCPPRQQEV